jgi:hypothetical protein
MSSMCHREFFLNLINIFVEVMLLMFLSLSLSGDVVVVGYLALPLSLPGRHSDGPRTGDCGVPPPG